MTKKKLEDQIERTSEPTGGVQAEDFIRPLLEEMSQKLRAPVLDLSSSEAANNSLKIIHETTRSLERYQEYLHKISPLLAQRRFELESNEETSD